MLHLHPEELRRRAKAGSVPATKIGESWIFIGQDLVGISSEATMLASGER